LKGGIEFKDPEKGDILMAGDIDAVTDSTVKMNGLETFFYIKDRGIYDLRCNFGYP